MANRHGYVEHDDVQQEVERFIAEAADSSQIIIPTVFTTEDDMMLVTGNADDKQVKLPVDTYRPGGFTNSPGRSNSYTPYRLASSMLKRTFRATAEVLNDEEVYYLGLTKLSGPKRLIVPILVDLDPVHTDPHLVNDTDDEHHWVTLDEVEAYSSPRRTGITEGMPGLADGTAAIINYYLEHDTYLDETQAATITV